MNQGLSGQPHIFFFEANVLFKTLSRQAVLVEHALGTKYELSEAGNSELADVLFKGAVDGYCLQCTHKTVFKIVEPYDREKHAANLKTYGVITIEASCQREWTGRGGFSCPGSLYVCFMRQNKELIKIGQYPSTADQDFGALDDAFRELDGEYRRELGRAIGLRAHGVGIGSFVYLRRIFERLLSEAHDRAAGDDSWDENHYSRSRIKERIELLRAELPVRLVASSPLYGVLSKGLHELSEDECLGLFDLVKQGIHYILAEKYEARQYEAVRHTLENVSSPSSGSDKIGDSKGG